MDGTGYDMMQAQSFAPMFSDPDAELFDDDEDEVPLSERRAVISTDYEAIA